MQKRLLIGSAVLLSTAGISSASPIISGAMVTSNQSTTGYFNFSSPSSTYSTGSYASNPVPSMINPVTNPGQDLAYGKTVTLLSGSLNTSYVGNSQAAALALLTDGPAQTNDDQPSASLFDMSATFSVEIDLGSNQTIGEFNTYSWHTATRTIQEYTLYAAPAGVTSTTDVTSAGWVDLGSASTYPALTNPNGNIAGGYQTGVSFQDTSGVLGTYEYLVIQSVYEGTFFGEAQVLAPVSVPEPASAATIAVLASGLLLRRRRRHV